MTLNGGKRGLLVNSVNICRHPPLATVKALGQNNRGTIYTTRLRGKCKKAKQGEKHHRGHERSRSGRSAQAPETVKENRR